MAIEKFLLTGVKADLPAVRDANKLYWCSDTRELYKSSIIILSPQTCLEFVVCCHLLLLVKKV